MERKISDDSSTSYEERKKKYKENRKEEGKTENFRKAENALIQPKFMDKMQIGGGF